MDVKGNVLLDRCNVSLDLGLRYQKEMEGKLSRVSLQAFIVAMYQVAGFSALNRHVLWVDAESVLNPADGCSVFLRNIGILLQDYAL
jgi:hypothetical protein